MKKLSVLWSLAALTGAALVMVTAPPGAAQRGAVLYSVSSDFLDNNLRRLDPATGATLAIVPMVASGKTIATANGLAAHPLTGQLFALLTLDDSPSPPQRTLATVDPQSGALTIIGNTGRAFAGIAFSGDGTLFGVTGDGGQPAETLFTIDPATAQSTAFAPLGNGTFGETIAWNPADGLLYHASGAGARNVDRIFETVDLQTKGVSPVALSGDESDEITALAHSQAFFLAADILGNFMKISPGGVVTILGAVDHTAKGLAFAPPPPTTLVASVLPSSRAVAVGAAATFFATIINAGSSPALGAGIALASLQGQASLTFNATDCATNAVVGLDNVAVDISPGLPACFVVTLVPTVPLGPTEVAFSFAASNAPPVTTLAGINTLLLLASQTPVPDMVALAATTSGDGIVTVGGGGAAFSVATANVGSAGLITASANTHGVGLPLTLLVCETEPASGQCKAAAAASVDTQVSGGGTPTFGIFVFATGPVPFDPAGHRVFVELSFGGVLVGRTSVAVRTP